jgi:putative inorganic carbon (HCO3(-)) transporter
MAFAARSWRPVILVGGALALPLLLVGLWVLVVSEWPAGGNPFVQSEADGEGGYGEIFDSGPSSTESLEGRLEIWSRALYGLEDFPFTGMGVGTFRRVLPVLYPRFLTSPDSDIAHAHNHLLQVGLDLGLPGLIAYVALWLLAGVMLWRSWRLRENGWQGALVIGFAGALVAYFVYGMVDTVALGAKPGFIFWLELGLVTGMHQLLSQGRRPTD